MTIIDHRVDVLLAETHLMKLGKLEVQIISVFMLIG